MDGDPTGKGKGVVVCELAYICRIDESECPHMKPHIATSICRNAGCISYSGAVEFSPIKACCVPIDDLIREKTLGDYEEIEIIK